MPKDELFPFMGTFASVLAAAWFLDRPDVVHAHFWMSGHAALARRRAYVHANRWTSLGLSLIESMHMAMPVLVLATTDAARTVPGEAGAIATDVEELVRASRLLLEDPDEARRRGLVAREAVLARHALGRFLADWDDLLDDAVARGARRNRAAGAALEGSLR